MRNSESEQNQAHQDAANFPKMNVVTIALNNILDFEGQVAPATRPDDSAIEAMVKRQFAFLRSRLKIEIGDQNVTISFTEKSVTAQTEVERLGERGAKKAAKGDYRRAISILNRVLELQPSYCPARRDLAMVYYELGNIETAKDHFVEVLRLNPRDAWSWVCLGAIYAMDENESPTAEKFLRRGLEISPGDPWALNNLAAIARRRGDIEEAIRLFREVIASRPEYPNSHYGLARAFCMRNELVLARRALDGFFINAREQDARSQRIAEAATALSAEVQASLAERPYPQALETVENLKTELEQASGYPVRIVEEDFEDMFGAAIEMAWKHGRDHHLIRCAIGLPEYLRIHFIAHELGRLRLETEARRTNKNRIFVTNDRTTAAAAQRAQNDLRELERKAILRDSKLGGAQELNHILAAFLYERPINMVIEARLRERFPTLSDMHFLSMRTITMRDIRIGKNAAVRQTMPRFVRQANLALGGAYALLVDHLYPGPTNYAAAYQGEESFSVAQQLFRHWQNRFPQLGPGDEYALVDEFGDILGLTGCFEWRIDPGTPK
jgi:Flp pilus assembly protein TadD